MKACVGTGLVAPLNINFDARRQPSSATRPGRLIARRMSFCTYRTGVVGTSVGPDTGENK
jgi:hypothetical protein